MRPTTPLNLNRREFLKSSMGVGASLIVGLYISGCQSTPEPEAVAKATAPNTAVPTNTAIPETAVPEATLPPLESYEPHILLKIESDNTVTVTVARAEMGQDVYTAFAMIVADELDADWSTVRVVQASGDAKYGRQSTGGSQSIISQWGNLRRIGAEARQILVEAAAELWKVEASTCQTENGMVIHAASDKKAAYGDLVKLAAQRPPVKNVTTKEPAQFKFIGKPQPKIHAPQIVTGQAIYGLDVKLPNMKYATLLRCPIVNGKLLKYDDTKAKAIVGVEQVIKLEETIAVIATNSWAAIQGKNAIEATWDGLSRATRSSAKALETLVTSAVPKPREGHLNETYTIPFLAHATMEPMNCTADVRADSCEVWVPTQVPEQAQVAAATFSELSSDKVTVHVTLMGGGFGRRLAVDYVEEAVKLSKAIAAPVQLLWTREDDMQHDLYHPMTVYHLSPEIKPTAQVGARGKSEQFLLQTGYWRAVDNFSNAFPAECAVDEIAAALKLDPYQMRREAMQNSSSSLAVLEMAATKGNWGDPLPAGSGRGIAFHATWGTTPVAQVAEVSVAKDGTVKVQRVVCAIDCGTVVNPDAVKAQIEGGIVYALSATLKPGITVENGAVQQSNFHDAPILRINEMPTIEVYIIPSDAPPKGVGEMGVPPLAPAIANAIFAATGKRVRHLPILPEDLI